MSRHLPLLPVQSRMARAALGWTTNALAKKCGIGTNTISRFENGTMEVSTSNLLRIRAEFEVAGIEFIDETESSGVGIRFKEQTMQIILGPSWHSERYIYFDVSKGGRVMRILVPRRIFDDLDRSSGYRGGTEYIASFERHRALILSTTEKVLGDLRLIRTDSQVELRPEDFPSVAFHPLAALV